MNCLCSSLSWQFHWQPFYANLWKNINFSTKFSFHDKVYNMNQEHRRKCTRLWKMFLQNKRLTKKSKLCERQPRKTFSAFQPTFHNFVNWFPIRHDEANLSIIFIRWNDKTLSSTNGKEVEIINIIHSSRNPKTPLLLLLWFNESRIFHRYDFITHRHPLAWGRCAPRYFVIIYRYTI